MRKLVPWAIAVGAVVLSGAGGAVAASQITGAQIKNASITGQDVKNKSLSAADFKGSVAGPQGPRGVTGPQGAPGPQGPAGPSGVASASAITVVPGALTIAPGDVDGGTIYCPAGQKVIGGGFAAFAAESEVFVSIANPDRTGWIIALDNVDSAAEGELEGEAYCAAAGKAVSASDSRARSEAEVARLVAERLASHR